MHTPVVLIFWVLCILVGCANYLYAREKIQPDLKEHPEESYEANKVLLYYLLWLTVPFALFGIVQFVGGFDDFNFVLKRQDNFYSYLSDTIILFWWGIAAFWIFFRNGGEAAEKYIYVRFGKHPASRWKLGIALMGLIIFWSIMSKQG